MFGGVGHYPHCEAPERFVQVLLDFMAAPPAKRVSEQRWRELLLGPAGASGSSVDPEVVGMSRMTHGGRVTGHSEG